eukprot:361082-Chlamydomonas_euryale.AAC.22
MALVPAHAPRSGFLYAKGCSGHAQRGGRARTRDVHRCGNSQRETRVSFSAADAAVVPAAAVVVAAVRAVHAGKTHPHAFAPHRIFSDGVVWPTSRLQLATRAQPIRMAEAILLTGRERAL